MASDSVACAHFSLAQMLMSMTRPTRLLVGSLLVGSCSLPSSLSLSRLVTVQRQRSSDSAVISRRQLVVGWIFAAASTAIPNSAQAACLPGDLSPECIGVYKVPLTDDYNAILPYVGTEKDLQRNAPDLKYVPPPERISSSATAWEMLETQRLAADDIRNVVAAGRLQEAGIKVLNLLPKITSAGMLLVRAAAAQQESDAAVAQLRQNKVQTAFQELTGLWGGVDVLIGQGIRGELGVSAVAQIQIIREIDDAIRGFDDFTALLAPPSGASGSRTR